MTLGFGWRSIFGLVAFAGIAIAVHYLTSAGETLPRDPRGREAGGLVPAE